MKTILAILAALVLGACANQLSSTTIPQPGAKYVDVLPIAGSQVPLPPGEWEVASAGLDRAGFGSAGSYAGQPEIGRAILLQIKDDRVAGAVSVRRSLGAAQFGWQRPAECDRMDVYFIRSDKSYNNRDTECYWVNHVILNRPSTPGGLADALDYVQRRGAIAPCTVLTQNYYFADRGEFISIMYATSAETAGFRNNTCNWIGSQWHRDRLSQDPRRSTFMSTLREQLELRLPLVKAGFAGKLAGQSASK
jgi:hypothetical protein